MTGTRWLKQVGLSIGLAIVFIAGFVYLTAPPCAFGAAECPVGSTSVFSENVGIQGGTTFTATIDSTPTGDFVYTIPATVANDTFALLGANNVFTGGTTGIKDHFINTGDGGTLTAENTNGTPLSFSLVDIIGPSSTADYDLLTISNDGADRSGNVLTVTGLGNVGIGVDPSNLLHIMQSDVAAIAPSASTAMAIESNSVQSYVSFISPTTGVSGLQWGDSGDVDRAHFRYSLNGDLFEWMFNSGTVQVAQLDGATGDWNMTGDIDLNNNTLIDVGAAGNDWTANTLSLVNSNVGGSNILEVENSDNTSTTSLAYFLADIGGTSGGDPMLRLRINGGQDVVLGLDNTVSDNFTISDNSTLGTNDRLRLATATGILSVDGAGTGDGLPTLFDNYNDVEELRGFQLANVSLSVASKSEQLKNQQRLVDIGVAEWALQDDGTNHFMIRVQSMDRLLAGGIYQSAELIERNAELLEILVVKIEELENEICELKEDC